MNKYLYNIFTFIKSPRNTFDSSQIKLSIKNQPLTLVDDVKFLGMHVDSNLNWKTHANALIKSLQRYLGIFYRIKQFISPNTMIMLYNALINSKLSYCLECWGTTTAETRNKILLIQKKLVRHIYNAHYLSHTAPLFTQARILTINKLYTLKLAVLAHLKYYQSANTENDPSHQHFTRYSLSSSLYSNKCQSNFGQKNVNNASIRVWNQLPMDLRKIKSKIGLKRHLRDHLLALE